MNTTGTHPSKQIRDLLLEVSEMPDHLLSVKPLKPSEISQIAHGLPPEDLAFLTEIGEICVSHRDCLVIESYLPCRLYDSPFYSFKEESLHHFKDLLIYAHDVDGKCYGYDTSSIPFGSCCWDFSFGGTSPIPEHGVSEVITKALTAHLLQLHNQARTEPERDT